MGKNEKTYVTKNGQLVIPARLRRKYSFKPGTQVCFIERGSQILLQPITKEYIRSMCGILKSETSMTRKLLKERARDKEREEEKFKKLGAR